MPLREAQLRGWGHGPGKDEYALSSSSRSFLRRQPIKLLGSARHICLPWLLCIWLQWLVYGFTLETADFS